jgi:hypothetical protein
MNSPGLRVLPLAACLAGLPCCVSARSAIDPSRQDTPVLLGPVRALGAAPAPPPDAPPEGEPITVRTRGSEGAILAMFGPRWQSTTHTSEHLDRLDLSPGTPVHVRGHRCYSLRVLGLLFYHVQVWCTVEADIASPPAAGGWKDPSAR